MSQMSKSVFEQFLDEINDGLPPQIIKSIDLIRQLDEQKQQLSAQTIDMAKTSFGQQNGKKKQDNSSKKTNSDGEHQQQKKVLNQIKANQDQIQRLSDFKIDLARKVFAFVELNLSKIKANQAKQQERQMNSQNNQSSISQKSKRICKPEKKGKKKQNGQKKQLERQASNQDEDYYMQEEFAEPVPYEMNRHLLRAFGPTNTGSSSSQLPANQQKSQSALQRNGAPTKEAQEPTYCFCNNISYGDMIACDNNNCPYEWFHFPCVGLSSKPVGSGWYCQKCLPSQQQPIRSSNAHHGTNYQQQQLLKNNNGQQQQQQQGCSNQQQQLQVVNSRKNGRRQKQGELENGENQNMTASFGFQSIDDMLNNNNGDKPLTRKKLQGSIINGNCTPSAAIQSTNSATQNSRPPTRSRRHL